MVPEMGRAAGGDLLRHLLAALSLVPSSRRGGTVSCRTGAARKGAGAASYLRSWPGIAPRREA